MASLPEKRRRPAGRWLALLGVVFLLGVANALVPVLRFDSQVANWAVACALFLLPVLAPVFVLRLQARRLLRILAVLGLTPLIAFSLLVAVVTGSCFQQARSTGTDPSFTALAQVPLEASRVTAYLSNTGSVGNLVVVVRHEKPLVPGVLLVRHLYADFSAYEATLAVVGPLTVEVRTENGGPTILTLRRFVYF